VKGGGIAFGSSRDRAGSRAVRFSSSTATTADCLIVAIASFGDLCAGFCEITSVPAPRLHPDAQGIIAFHLQWRGVTVNVAHCPARTKDHVFVLFELGPVAQEDEAAVRRMRSLLDANFPSLTDRAPTFSCNPVSGDAVMQYAFPFFEATPQGLFELIERGVDQALHWRHGPAPVAQSALLVEFA
jgi:hypothetical protein